ncbi:MAG TPA: CehA/McbA family metallohydrolase [Planctomycetota bacterium]|nr:CehA/McbA family metallohydrolase [Planctomycetota bacterium]
MRTAKPSVRDDLLADLARPRHASDGGGRAWIEPIEGRPIAVVAGESSAWRVVYEAGELGIAAGGSLFLQISPFWGWSTPQVEAPEAAGFTRVSTDAKGVGLDAQTLDVQLLAVKISGRGLARGERVIFDYGAGPSGAKADDFAESCSRFWIAVDGDGDGVRQALADSPCVDVQAGPPAILSAVAPTSLRPGETGKLHIALLDAAGDAGVHAHAVLRFEAAPAWLKFDTKLELRADLGSSCVLPFTPTEEGMFRWRAVAALDDGRELSCSIGPLLVSATAPRVLWADLHGHSGESDGTGSVEAYWRYARDIAGLDAASLTDHDHWGMRFLDRTGSDWKAFAATARSFDQPGSFVALPGYEYTDWIHGHRCVVWFGDEAELYSSMDPRYDTPQELWAALRGKRALTIPHHVGGGPIALDWSIRSDPELEPVVEIVSVHGSSEAQDSDKRIYAPVPGNFARDGLANGSLLGFIGSGDSHDGHPGLAQLGGHYPCSGLAAIVCEERTPAALYEALRSRRVYATSGARILLRFSFAGQPMGAVASMADVAKSSQLFARAIGTSPIRRIDVILGGEVAISVEGDGTAELVVSGALTDVRAGDWVYVRVVQADGELAWSSPIFVR